MFKTLKITSQNPDVYGTWFKNDVEEEMNDVGATPKTDHDWIEWIFSHVFDIVRNEKIQEVLSNVAENDFISQITLDIDEIGTCKILKK